MGLSLATAYPSIDAESKVKPMTEAGWTAQRDEAVPKDVERLLATVLEWFGRPTKSISPSSTVRPRRGVGTAMIEAITEDVLARGVKLLEVKTLGPSKDDPNYARTRHFYEKMGFLPLEETDLWGADTPCLILVKPLV